VISHGGHLGISNSYRKHKRINDYLVGFISAAPYEKKAFVMVKSRTSPTDEYKTIHE
jgi:hypothetical protein